MKPIQQASSLPEREKRAANFWGLWSVVLCALPLISFGLSLISWLSNGVDLPNYDDWRFLDNENLGKFSLSRFLTIGGGTLAPVGYFLDDLAQKFLHGNSVAYQVLSYSVVMGSLLSLQWAILRRVLRDFVLCAACFSLTLFMLQPGSYWGSQNLAYHQALPLVFILGIIRLMLADSLLDRYRQPLVFILGLLAGIAYISGAFAILATGVFFLCFSWALLHKSNKAGVSLRRAGTILTLIGLITAFEHCYWALIPRNGVDPHPVPKAWPYEPDFWWYLLGKLGRALLLPGGSPGFSLALSLLVGCAIVLSMCWGVRHLMRSDQVDQPSIHLMSVIGPLFFGVSVYLLMVAVGRTHWRPAEIQLPLEVFGFGMQRFHYFWVTLWWPWCAGVACFLILRSRPMSMTWLRRISLSLATLLVVYAIHAGALEHDRYFRDVSGSQLALRECLIKRLQEGRPLQCPQVDFLPDLSRSYAYARGIQASFVRSVPILPTPDESTLAPSWYKFSRDKALVQASWRNATPQRGEQDFETIHGQNPQLWLHMPEVLPMTTCRVLEIAVQMQSRQDDVVRVYSPIGPEDEFQMARSLALPVHALQDGKFETLNFILESSVGFGHRVRIDLAAASPSIRLKDVDLRCKLKVLP